MIVENVLYGDDERIAKWVQRKLGNDNITPPYVAMGLVYAGKVRGGVVWFNRRGNDITVSVYAGHPGLAQPRIISQVVAYPFIQLELDRITAEIAATNTRSVRNARMMGFRLEGRKRNASADGSDELILGMKRDEFVFKEQLRALEIETWADHQAYLLHQTPLTQEPQQPPNAARTSEQADIMS